MMIFAHRLKFPVRGSQTLVFMVPVAQWIARWTSNPEVVGSNPTGDDQFF